MGVAEVPSLPGCVSQGTTREEALENIAEAADLWMESVRGLGHPLPSDPLSAEVVRLPLPKAG